MSKVKVAVYGSPLKTVFIDTTVGARVDALETQIAQLAAAGSNIRHSQLQGLQIGDDHPQYTMWQAAETIRALWNFQQEPDIEGIPLTEFIEDVVGNELVENSTSISWTYDDTGNALQAHIIDEYVQDLVGAMLTDSTSVDFTYDDTLGTFTASTINANPTATIGLSAVNGTAATPMRSDAAPALSQAITPTWSALHTFSLTPVVPNDSWTYAKIQNVSATSRVLGRITAGAGDIEELTSANLATIIGSSLAANPTASVGLTAVNGSASTYMRSDAAPALSQSIAPTWSATHTFSLTPVVPNDSWTYAKIQNVSATSRVLGRITTGAGDIEELTGANLATIIGTALGANPTASVGLTAVNGTAGTYMRSDAAPALSQSIAPTWSATHTFSNTPVVPDTSWTYAKIQNVSATSRVLGRITAGAGVIEELTGANLATIIGTNLGGNPTASVGLAAVNGSAATYMRSDGAPALSQSIAPTWTGLHIFSNSNTLFGATASVSVGNSARLQSFGTAVQGASQSIVRGSADTGGPRIALGKSRNTTYGSFTAVVADDSLGQFQFHGDDGTTYNTAGVQINAFCDGTVSTGVVPGRIDIRTATSAGTLTERLRIISNGAWGLAGANYGTSGQALTSNGTGSAPTWQTVAGGVTGLANPTASVGLTAVNGSATTAMRSDGAPALDVSISPTWSGTHTFSNVPVVPADSWTYAKIQNVSATNRVLGRITSGAGDIEELTAANLITILGGGGLQGANPSASVGLSAVNGSATSYMRSDGAPALSQSISPTWTGNHTFTPASGNTIFHAGNVKLDLDSQELQLGVGTAGVGDLRLYHDGTNSIIRNDTGSLNIQAGATVGLAISSAGALSSAQTGTWTGNHTWGASNRLTSITGSTGQVTHRYDDNGVGTLYQLLNLGITGANQGVEMLFRFGTDAVNAFDGGYIRALTSGDYSTGTTRDSYLSFAVSVDAANAEVMRVDGSTTADDVRLYLWDVSAGTLKRVTRGASDSGGTGFRVLRIAN